MKLYSLKIEGLRRHLCSEIFLSDATFLIGENNIGKSSALVALKYLLNDYKRLPDEEFYCTSCESVNIRLTDKVILTAEFRNVPEEAKQWMGFKGRILPYDIPNGSDESGNRLIYRKTYEHGKDCVVELREYKRSRNPVFNGCKSLNEYLEKGLREEAIPDTLKAIDRTKDLTKPQMQTLEDLDDLFIFDESEETWFKNPGGIPGNVLIRLPKFLLIPAQDKVDELTGNSGTLLSTLNELFNEIRDSSENFREAQKYLKLLSEEMNPEDKDSEMGKMMGELNDVMSEVFPNTGLNAAADLSDANSVIKPKFTISMFSNITSAVPLQGTGLIRSAVFALLRYKYLRDNRRSAEGDHPVRSLLIGFEEPEIYLHPNAAFKMRDIIYELAGSEFNQIICTTHSTYMIDLSRKQNQILNSFCVTDDIVNYDQKEFRIKKISIYPFNTSKAFKALQEDEKTYVKMLLKMDDSITKVFFASKVLIVEGDTEDIVLRESITRLPDEVKNHVLSTWEIVKARGKASIISLVKYLRAMNIDPYVIHDEDSCTPNAVIFNGPIVEALGIPEKRIMLHDCIEDVLGYTPPESEKPYKAYTYVNKTWGETWDTVSESWRNLLEQIFSESFALFR